MAVVQFVAFILFITSTIGLIIEIVNLHFFFRKGGAVPQLKRFPAISIIKALKGIDVKLIENLETFCDIHYPNYEIIFSVADPEDQVILLIHNYMSQNNQVRMKLVVDPSNIGFNPQISNFNN
jgi:cellulose synthase/poly-beta-1,6-N-acetylglucosamine synthase-like glycosyltransferase